MSPLSPTFESTYHHLHTTSTSNLLRRNFPAAYDNAQSLLKLYANASPPGGRWETLTVWERWGAMREGQIKAVKLNITVVTSIFIDAITNTVGANPKSARRVEGYPADLSELLRRLGTGSVNKDKIAALVNYLITYTTSTYIPSTPTPKPSSLSVLPPPILVTLLLSLLKLSSSLPSPWPVASRKLKSIEVEFLERGRTVFEDWLASIQAALGDDELEALYHPKRHHDLESESLSSSTASHPSSNVSSAPSQISTVLSKAYKSSLRLYVLEFLPRLGEWELAREIVCGGLVRGAGEKERILKKLHSMETKSKQRSLSSSQMRHLPTDNLNTGDKSSRNAAERVLGGAGGGSRRSSMSDETERTVRPVDFLKPVSGAVAAGGHGRQTAAAGEREMLQPPMTKMSSRTSDISATSSSRVRAQARIFERKAKIERKDGQFRQMKLASAPRRSSSSSGVNSGSGSGDESEGSSFIEIRRSVDLEEDDEGGSSGEENSLDGASTTLEKAEDEEDEVPAALPPQNRRSGGQRSSTSPSPPPSQPPAKRTAFEALRDRITRYLDEPIPRNNPTASGQGTPSPSRPGRPRTLSLSRPNLPLHLRISQNPIFRILTRSLAIISIIFFILGLLRQNRRRRLRKRGQVIGNESVWTEVGREMWRSVSVALDKIREFGKMGTTITYV